MRISSEDNVSLDPYKAELISFAYFAVEIRWYESRSIGLVCRHTSSGCSCITFINIV